LVNIVYVGTGSVRTYVATHTRSLVGVICVYSLVAKKEEEEEEEEEQTTVQVVYDLPVGGLRNCCYRGPVP
jgi:hypothetical protein